MSIKDPIKTTVEEISKVLDLDNVVGKTIETDELLMIPLTRMGMGFGAGMGESSGPNKSGGLGEGAGGAAGIEPTTMVVVYKGVSGPEGVKVMSLKSPDRLTMAIREIGNVALEIMNKENKMINERVEYYKKKKQKKQK